MMKIEREDIHLLSRHSNLSEKSLKQLLKNHIYNTPKSWSSFLSLFCLSLGIGFTASGIIFFFAYNWANLHKFLKIGLIEGLLIITILLATFLKTSSLVKNILLLGGSILVGVLFAVFGQIYQTGANAYDFFFGWTLAILLWTLVTNFPPLWLLNIVLINTTLVLYVNQIAFHWSNVFSFGLLFGINTLLWFFFMLLKNRTNVKVPTWFSHIIAIGAISFSTIGLILGLFDTINFSFFILLLFTLIIYGLGIIYGYKQKSTFLLATIPFSTIIILSAYLIRLNSEVGMFLFVTVFIITSITLLISNLIQLHKNNE